MSEEYVPTSEPEAEAPASPPAPEPQPAAAPASAPPAGWYGGQQQLFDPRQKSPRMAAVLAAFPGLGQIYIGYYVRGFITAATFVLLILAADTTQGDIAPLFGFSAFFLWMFNVVDAGRMAALYNHAVAGSRAIELPDDFKMPAMGGSIAGGALLVAFGLIALSNTAFGYELEWLENWWPIFPVALGGYLLARGVMDRVE